MNKLNNILYRIWHDIRGMLLLFLIIGFMTGCAASKGSLSNTPQSEPQAEQGIEDANASSQTEVQTEEQSVPYSAPASSRPSVSWQPSFTVEDIQVKENALGLPELEVGANIESQSGKVVLRDIIRGLAQLKGFNVSWNKDANPNAMVDVDIKTDDDFWVAMDNVLRQLDYFFEFKNDTLIIGYKQIKTYQVSMPNVSYTFTSAIGGNMLGGCTNTKNLGEISLSTISAEGTDWAKEKTIRYINRYDLWKTFRQNLDQILEIWEMEKVERTTSTSVAAQASQDIQKKEEQSQDKEGETEEPSAKAAEWVSLGKGSYTIDESLGIVTVEASRSLQKRASDYVDIFKSWLYRQVSIQAHILEVELSEGTSRGIDWSRVFKAIDRDSALIHGSIEYGDQGSVYEVDYTDLGASTRDGLRLLGKINLAATDFNIFVNALDEQGKVRTISEPRLNLLNGSPGVLTVGESIRYIREISKDVTSSGTTSVISYTAETDDILSGLAFSVICNILGDDEVILYLTPVTSQLKEPIEYKVIGDTNLQIGLPRVKLRQMSTLAKVRDGNLLILGGLIDEVSENNSSEIPLLGKIPWVKWAFKNEIKSKIRRELIIILRPRILPI